MQQMRDIIAIDLQNKTTDTTFLTVQTKYKAIKYHKNINIDSLYTIHIHTHTYYISWVNFNASHIS